MLNSSQLLDKYKIIFLLFLSIFTLLSSYVSAFEFGISPSELSFQGVQGQEICQKVNLFSSLNEINIALKDKWSIESNPSKNLNDYLMESDDLKIILTYEQNFILNNQKEIKICLKSKDFGKFRGVLFFQALDRSLNIGIWLNADISKSNQASKITGFSINDSDINNSMNIVLPITLFNLFLFFMLFFVYNKRKKLKYNSQLVN